MPKIPFSTSQVVIIGKHVGGGNKAPGSAFLRSVGDSFLPKTDMTTRRMSRE